MVLELKSKALHQLCHGNALCSCGLTLVLGRSCFVLRRVVYFEDCLLLALYLTMSKGCQKKKKEKKDRKDRSNLLFVMIHRLCICAKPWAERLLKKIMEEQDRLSHNLSSMFVSSVYRDQPSGTYLQHLQHMETARGQRLNCMQTCHAFLMLGGGKDKA